MNVGVSRYGIPYQNWHIVVLSRFESFRLRKYYTVTLSEFSVLPNLYYDQFSISIPSIFRYVVPNSIYHIFTVCRILVQHSAIPSFYVRSHMIENSVYCCIAYCCRNGIFWYKIIPCWKSHYTRILIFLIFFQYEKCGTTLFCSIFPPLPACNYKI